MSQRPLVIIHGWSDHAASFDHLAKQLSQTISAPIEHIYLADYISMDDEVTLEDLVFAMRAAWQTKQLPSGFRSVDVVVHSTGGLIIRDWLTRFFTPETTPIFHLLMLAPANFGSPLAHKGESFIGRVIKGFESNEFFQVGEKILQALELSSPYSWNLAMRDRFGEKNFYDVFKTLVTVLVGTTGYTGISAAANEPGSDGTVRIAGANLNCDFWEADFSQNPLKPTLTRHVSSGKTAFGLMTGENHLTITSPENSPCQPETFKAMVRALTVSDGDFSVFCDDLTKQNAGVSKGLAFQNQVYFVTDQFNTHVQDYFLEFYIEKDQHEMTRQFYEQVMTTVHSYSQDASFRNLYLNCDTLYSQLQAPFETLHVSLTAMPEISQNRHVGYRTLTDDDIGSFAIPRDEVTQVLQPYRTLLVKIILRREQAADVFQFLNASKDSK